MTLFFAGWEKKREGNEKIKDSRTISESNVKTLRDES